jgi:hypothetical protein
MMLFESILDVSAILSRVVNSEIGEWILLEAGDQTAFAIIDCEIVRLYINGSG